VLFTLKEGAMHLAPIAYLWLAGSLLAAWIVDYACVRLLLEALRPASAHLFTAARVGKLASLLAWIAFFDGFWYREYLSDTVPFFVRGIEGAVVAVVLVGAIATHPRVRNRVAGHA
jgi:hypothetical protein